MGDQIATEARPESGLPSASGISYVAIQSQLLDLIGKAGEATKSAATPEELQACGQLTRRLCHALTGL